MNKTTEAQIRNLVLDMHLSEAREVLIRHKKNKENYDNFIKSPFDVNHAKIKSDELGGLIEIFESTFSNWNKLKRERKKCSHNVQKTSQEDNDGS